MNNRSNKLLQYNLSGLGCWGSLLLVVIIGATVGFKWIVGSFLLTIALLTILPFAAVWGFQWWLKRKLIQAQCPVCSYEFTGFKNTEFSCPSCGEALQVEGTSFSRMTPPGTIDIDAVEVSSVQVIEESS